MKSPATPVAEKSINIIAISMQMLYNYIIMRNELETKIFTQRDIREAEELARASGVAFRVVLESLYRKGTEGLSLPLPKRGLVGVKGPMLKGGFDG